MLIYCFKLKNLRYSNDGKSWNNRNTTVKAATESGAKAEIRKKFKYVSDIRIMSVREG